MKKKSTIFALIGVICVVVAMYFVYKETRDTYDIYIDEEPEPDEEPEADKETEPTKGKNEPEEETTGTGTGTETNQ